MYGRSSQLFIAGLLEDDCLNQGGTCDEHITGLVHHENEIHEGRRVGLPSCDGSHDEGDLRNHAGGAYVAEKELAILAQCPHLFGDPGPTGIIDAYDGHAHSAR